jgi:hypothetical protein
MPSQYKNSKIHKPITPPRHNHKKIINHRSPNQPIIKQKQPYSSYPIAINTQHKN